MGAAMGFLAFLVVGGCSGLFAFVFYPRLKQRRKTKPALISAFLIGFCAALASSYAGQLTGIFQSGQILEWFSAILVASLAGCLYTFCSK
jgi:multisubunit Na+/H+ antiporter MnhB subunit